MSKTAPTYFYAITSALGALALYSFCSQSLALAFIWLYSQPGHPISQLGYLSACGASGLAFGQIVNLALLFYLGSHRIVALASLSLIALFPFSIVFCHFPAHLFARFLLGWIDGMMFLVIENALVLFSPQKLRASALSAYLFTLYVAALCAPYFGAQLISANLWIAAGLILGALASPALFLWTPTFLQNQKNDDACSWSLGEWSLAKKGGFGVFLCALSGAVTPLWTAFLPSMVHKAFPLAATVLVTLFFCGGLLGQIAIIGNRGYISSQRMTQVLVYIGLLAATALCLPVAWSISMFAIWTMILAFCVFPLYGLGLDLALEPIEQAHWVRANRTFLTAYTLPAIFSPLFFPYYPLSLESLLPLFSAIAFIAAIFFPKKSLGSGRQF